MARRNNLIIFNGGISTEPEVKKIIDELGTLEIGQQIPYKELETILGHPRTHGRWKSVISAWRKQIERQNNILLMAIPNEGFQIMTNSERVKYCSVQFKGGLKKIRRAGTIAASTDRKGLTAEEKVAAEYFQTNESSLRLAAQTAARQLTYPEPG